MRLYKRPSRLIELVKTIPNSDVAWAVGFIAADGHIRYDPSSGERLAICLSKKDRGVLVKLRKILRVEDRPIHSSIQRGHEMVSLSVYGKGIVEAFSSWGLHQDKTKSFKVPKDMPFMADFIRGYFDGDGHVSSRDRKGSKYKKNAVGITVGSDSLRKGMKRLLKKETGLTFSETNLQLRIFSRSDISIFYDYLYASGGTCLARKKKSFESLLSSYLKN